jgi:hypothetical protein
VTGRRPLVLASGGIRELPAADTLVGGAVQQIVGETAVTSVATIDVDLTGGWEAVDILFADLEPAAAGTLLFGRISINGPSSPTFRSTAGDYRYALGGLTETALGWSNGGSDVALVLSGGIAGSGGGCSGHIRVHRPATSNFYKLMSSRISYSATGGATTEAFMSGRFVGTTGALTNFRLYLSSSSNIAAAKYAVYGWKA